jgi:hypothetical protein
MNIRLHKSPIPSFATASGFLIAVLMIARSLFASTANFSVPEDTALRIRLDVTLTSVDSDR